LILGLNLAEKPNLSKDSLELKNTDFGQKQKSRETTKIKNGDSTYSFFALSFMN